MSGKAARDKGARGERELAEILSDRLGFAVKRQLGQARDGGDDIRVGHYRIEVKRRERLSVEDWAKQVEAVAGPGEVPVVAFRRNGEPWRCVVPLDWVIDQIRETIDERSREEGDRGRGGGDGDEILQ